jgi:hypothetical protein
VLFLLYVHIIILVCTPAVAGILHVHADYRFLF